MNIFNLRGFRVLPIAGLLMLVVGLSVSAVVGQVTRIDSSNLFADSIHLSFEELQAASPETVRVISEDVYSVLGLSISGEGSSVPGIFLAQYYLAFPRWDHAIRNSSATGSSADEVLILRFRYPIQRLGMRLGNGTAETKATLKAYGLKGDYLGSVERTDVRSPQTISTLEEIPFLGLESATPVGTVVLDYGTEPAGEQIYDLYLDYAGDRSFVTYLPHVADGQAGEATVRTILQIQNPFQMPVPVQVDFVGEGQPLGLLIGDENRSSLSFVLPVRGSTQVETSGKTSPLAIGFARVQSRLPLKAQALFQVQGKDGETLQESGFQSTQARLFQTIPVEVNREAGLDTGIAIANENDFPVVVALSLTNPAGEPGQGGSSRTYTIPPRSQRAFFVTEAFAQLSQASFIGSVRIFTGGAEGRTLPVAASGLRTIRGIAVSSIPAVGTSQ